MELSLLTMISFTAAMFVLYLSIGLAHENAGWAARTTVRLRSTVLGEIFQLPMLKELGNFCAVSLAAWDDSLSKVPPFTLYPGMTP